MDQQEDRDQQVLVPDLQSTITFHGKPLIAVRLSNGDHGVVLRWLCENLHLDVTAQIQRIKRTEAIADDLVYVRIQTDGGPQVMPALVLRAVPYNRVLFHVGATLMLIPLLAQNGMSTKPPIVLFSLGEIQRSLGKSPSFHRFLGKRLKRALQRRSGIEVNSAKSRERGLLQEVASGSMEKSSKYITGNQ